MIGIILLTIAIVLYFNARYRYISYIIYLSFMLGYGGGFGLTTDAVLGAKNMDMAIIYTLVISIYLLIIRQYKLPKFKFIRWYKIFLIYFACDVVFSYVHYGFSFFQILQGGRSFLLILSLPILLRIKPIELAKLFPILLYITVITSVLYILQVVVGRPLMPYSLEVSIDQSVGLIRMYNIPALLEFFLALTFVLPEYFGKTVNFYRALFFVTLMCTLGRTGIISSLMVVILCIMFLGKATRVIKVIFVIGILFVPFSGFVVDRFVGGETTTDLSALSSGSYKDFESGDGGTMTYRFAWIYERVEYLVRRPIGEQIFGLGLISDSQHEVSQMYHFKIGLRNPETNLPVQLSTPDIAYGNLISKLGFVGGIIYLCFIVSLAIFLYKNKKNNALMIVAAAQIILLFLGSMAGSGLSEPKNLTMYFVIMSTLFYRNQSSLLSRHKDLLLYKGLNT